MMSLDHYRLLGRSGLRVSPLALGTMTFGKDWGWGADASESRRMFDHYLDRGGNFDRLNSVSAPPPIFPERFVARPMVQQLIFGGATVQTRR